jgi:hypothetical protein
MHGTALHGRESQSIGKPFLSRKQDQVMKPEKYPFDFDSLQKGEFIPPEKIEAIVKLPRDHQYYSLKVLALREQIETELDARGRPVNVKSEKGGLRILTDEEARPYAEGLFNQAARALRRSHLRSCIIDTTNLSDEDKKRLERTIISQGAKLAAMRKAGRNLSAELMEGQKKIEQ